jgi:hypothetical protein
VRTDSDGDTLWTRTFGGTNYDEGYSVQQTSDGGYIITGYTESFGAGNEDVYLIKTNGRGIARWTRTFGGRKYDCGYSVRQVAGGGYVIAGRTASFGGGGLHIYLVRVDANGAVLWTRTLGGVISNYDASFQLTTDGGYIIVGSIYPQGEDECDVHLIKTDAGGDTLWTKTYGGGMDDLGYSVQQTTDGGYIIAGTTWSFGPAGPDVYLLRTDSSGDTMWTKTFGGAYFDEGYSVQQTADNGFIIAGYSGYSGADGYYVYLIKTDAQGHVAIEEPKTSPTRGTTPLLSCEPNPCREATRISLAPQASNSKPLTLRVYDSQGCLVHSVSAIRASSFPLDLRGLPSGTYFIRCDAAGKHASTRIVLQR